MRKLPMEAGAVVRGYLDEIRALDCELAASGEPFAGVRANLAAAVEALGGATEWLLERVADAPGAVAAGASPYIQMFGVVAGGHYLARSALTAQRLIADGQDSTWLANKLVTARFYAEQILPQAAAQLPAVTAGAERLFEIAADDF